MRLLHTILLALLAACPLLAQEKKDPETRQVSGDTIAAGAMFDASSAWDYLDRASRNKELWRADSDSITDALRRLLEHTRAPYDSTRLFLQENDFSKVPVHRGEPLILETIDVRWINDSTFVLDPQGWNSNLYLKEEEQYVYPVDLSSLALSDSLLDENRMLDSTLFIRDTIILSIIDTAAIRELGIKLYSYKNGTVIPPLSDQVSGRVAHLSRDRLKVNYSLPGTTWLADERLSIFHSQRPEAAGFASTGDQHPY